MIDVLGIVNIEDDSVRVRGISEFRTIPAMSFLGRYRIIDFVLSNMVNSGIDQIKVMVKDKPRSLIEHLGNGHQYNINFKHGFLELFYPDHSAANDAYYHDLYIMRENMEYFERSRKKYVIISPSYMLCRLDYSKVLEAHEKSGADVTLVYSSQTRTNKEFIGCHYLEMKDGRVTDIKQNFGFNAKSDIFMETYVVERELFMKLIAESKDVSPLFTLMDRIQSLCGELNIRGYEYEGYLRCINSLETYYKYNMELIDSEKASQLFHDDWEIYTKTNDSPPAFYAKSAHVKKSLVANGCIVEGDLDNCILGRGVKVREGASIKNTLLLPYCEIGEFKHIENAIIDKHAKVLKKKELIGTPDNLVYIRRRDKV